MFFVGMSAKLTKQTAIQNEITEDAFKLPVRVYYQDTDAGGVVYHATHLNFMERARYEWLRDLGFDDPTLREVYKVLFMVRSLEIEYFKPAVLDDLVHVAVQVTHLGRSSISIAQQILRDDTVLIRANIGVVCVGTDSLKPVRVPSPLREKIEGLL